MGKNAVKNAHSGHKNGKSAVTNGQKQFSGSNHKVSYYDIRAALCKRACFGLFAWKGALGKLL